MRVLFALLTLGLLACDDPSSGDSPAVGTQVQSLTFWPPEAGRGQTLDAKITSTNSIFEFVDNSLDLGGGVTVNSLTVLDGWSAVANVTVDPAATLGPRDGYLDTRGGSFTMGGALTIVDDSFTVAPSRARIGEHLRVELIGNNTEWVSGKTWAGFGEDVEVTAVDVLSETYLVAEITVAPEAVPGLRDVYVENGNDLTTQFGAFQVDRVGISATFDPPEMKQGQSVTFTIVGKDTHFTDRTELRFFQYGDEKQDIVIDSMTVIDSENLYGRLTVSNAALLGTRDIIVTTGQEGVYLEDATTVLDGDLDLSNVVISRWFYVVRGIDNQTGEIAEYVRVGALFYLPLDPACPPDPESSCSDMIDNDDDDYTDCYDSDCSSDPACAGGPQPYDANGVWPTYTTGGSADCPDPETLSAGDRVWLVSDCNIVTLEKQIDGSSGMIYYTKDDVSLSDYCFDQMYDLQTEGDPLGIPAEVVEDAQPTVPADFEMLDPGWWGNFTHNRAEDLTYTWTPAQTYPDAIFGTQISGQLVEPDGWSGFAGSLPWDDGEHTYTPAELGQLKDGNASFAAFSFIEGPPVGFSFSTIQTKSTSVVQVGGTVILE